jgi:hypothetical protein
MRKMSFLIVMLGFAISPAMADQCADDVALLDKALSNDTLASDVKAQAKDIRNQADQLCKAGNTEEGLAQAAEAKVLLQLD